MTLILLGAGAVVAIGLSIYTCLKPKGYLRETEKEEYINVIQEEAGDF